MAADDKLAALERLAKLRAGGIITEAEFTAEKAAVLAGRDVQPTALPQVYTSPPPPAASPTIIYAQPPRRGGGFWRSLGGIVILLIGVAIVAAIRSQPGQVQTAAAAEIPTCDSSDAKETLTNTIEHSAAEKIVSMRVLDVANITQSGYDPSKPSRSCAADVTLNNGDRHLTYEMHFNSDRTGVILSSQGDPADDILSLDSMPSDVPANGPSPHLATRA